MFIDGSEKLQEIIQYTLKICWYLYRITQSRTREVTEVNNKI